MKFWEYTYHSPWWFCLFAIIPILIFFKIFKNANKETVIGHSGFSLFANKNSLISGLLINIPFVLRMLAFSFLIIAMARPQQILDDDTITEQSIEGIDLVLSMDISKSMEALDFKPNRLGAAKKVAKNFVKKRPNDRIGLVVYEGESYTACALTTDHESLLKRFDNIESGKIGEGTAIGMGIATAINRLRESEAKSRVVILLTDGENNTGKIHPITASQYAKELGIRVYTVGIGTTGRVRMPGGSAFGANYIDSKIDENMLKEIAKNTDGKYYRAKNIRQLESIYGEIDKLEKSKINTIQYKRDFPEAFHWFVVVALILLVLEYILKNFILRVNS
ncbi:VWA domain-containing protein [bacterium]|nr:VWA domain-containing protein [bacterium]MDB4088204.1 VWA domain-containing protein [Flavobacteriales bacterium]